jgi:arylsulfatase
MQTESQRTPVSDDYQLPFRFSGTINQLTLNLGPAQLTESDSKVIAQKLAAAKD